MTLNPKSTLTDFPMHIDIVNIGLPIVYFKGPQVDFSKFLSLKIVFLSLQTVHTLLKCRIMIVF